jgi:hypothetical protein
MEKMRPRDSKRESRILKPLKENTDFWNAVCLLVRRSSLEIVLNRHLRVYLLQNVVWRIKRTLSKRKLPPPPQHTQT